MPFWMNLAQSSWPNTHKRASEVISLAEHSEGRDQDTLLGCAMLLLAIALEQGLTTHLRTLSQLCDATGVVPNPVAPLDGSPLKTRLFEAPKISQYLPLRLDPDSDYVDYLTELIDRRNSLMHFAESPISFVVEGISEVLPTSRIVHDATRPSGATSWEGEILVINVNPNDLKSAVGPNPWGDVTLAETRRTLTAVELYLDGLSDPENCSLFVPL